MNSAVRFPAWVEVKFRLLPMNLALEGGDNENRCWVIWQKKFAEDVAIKL